MISEVVDALNRQSMQITRSKGWYKISRKFAALNIPSMYLMGHSFGGILVTQYTADYSQYVKGLVMLNASLNIQKSIEDQKAFFIRSLKEDQLKPDTIQELLPRFAFYQNKMIEQGILYTTLTDSKANFDTLNTIDEAIPSDFAFAKTVFEIQDYLQDFAPLTATINVATIVFTGKRDFAIGVEHYKLLRFPKQKVIHFEKGHLAYYEENDVLKKYLAAFKKEH